MFNFKNIVGFHFGNLGFLFFLFLVLACKQEDKKLLIGKWQNEQDWFEYFENGKYSSGKSFVTMIKNYNYKIDEVKNELSMYTNDKNQTYYLKYAFVHSDTLSIYNLLSTNNTPIKFYRVKK